MGGITLPNTKKKILYVGTNPSLYKEKGFQIIHWSLITTAPLMLRGRSLTRLLELVEECDIIILTSPFAVRCFFDIIRQHYPTSKELQKKRFAVIGRYTYQQLQKEGAYTR